MTYYGVSKQGLPDGFGMMLKKNTLEETLYEGEFKEGEFLKGHLIKAGGKLM